jgi:two-component system, NarL family, response regulator DevR
MMATGAEPIKVLIIDDHKIIRDGLKDLISSRGGMTVVGEAGNSADAVRIAALEHPDVIILDLVLADESGLDLIPELQRVREQASILILTGVRDAEKRDKAIEIGARGVVLKDQGAAELLSAIEKVHRPGEYWLEPGATQRLLERRRARSNELRDPEALNISRLTRRELEIIALVGEGLENREIAERLRPIVAESTVRNNLSVIYEKLQIQGGRLGLLVYSYKHRLVGSDARED